MTDHPRNESEGFEITADAIRVLRRFTGEGLMSCHKALKSAKGDLLMAAGYLKYDGILVNFKGGDRGQYIELMARDYAQDLRVTDGEIERISEPEILRSSRVEDHESPSP